MSEPTFHCDRGDHEPTGRPASVATVLDPDRLTASSLTMDGDVRVVRHCARHHLDDVASDRDHPNLEDIVREIAECDGVVGVEAAATSDHSYRVQVRFDAETITADSVADVAGGYDLRIWRVNFETRELLFVPATEFDYEYDRTTSLRPYSWRPEP